MYQKFLERGGSYGVCEREWGYHKTEESEEERLVVLSPGWVRRASRKECTAPGWRISFWLSEGDRSVGGRKHILLRLMTAILMLHNVILWSHDCYTEITWSLSCGRHMITILKSHDCYTVDITWWCVPVSVDCTTGKWVPLLWTPNPKKQTESVVTLGHGYIHNTVQDPTRPHQLALFPGPLFVGGSGLRMRLLIRVNPVPN